MTIALAWSEIALRLVCAIAAGALIGINRSEHGRAAGLRTSILVTLTACVAMIQVNLLLPLAGRPADSFVMNDLMRLPLGILSGMGFIGAGAIVRRDKLVVGVTTAATLWFLTVIGLCFGGGQIALGAAGSALGMVILSAMKLLEDRMKQDQQGKLVIVTAPSGPTEEAIRAILQNSGFRISSCAFTASRRDAQHRFICALRWRANFKETAIPDVIHSLAEQEGVVRVAWTPRLR